MSKIELRFEPVDLDAAAEVCVRFRADSFVCSFGSEERFYEADGKGHERYLDWIRRSTQALPGCCVHVWAGEQIVGQIEMNRPKEDSTIGYVNLYYLEQVYRDRGLGRCLDEYAIAYLKRLGARRARLSVSPTNQQAVRFYLKNNWRDLGPLPDDPEVHLMEKELA